MSNLSNVRDRSDVSDQSDVSNVRDQNDVSDQSYWCE